MWRIICCESMFISVGGIEYIPLFMSTKMLIAMHFMMRLNSFEAKVK